MTNLTHYRGDTLARVITVDVAGAVFDITGYTFFFTIKSLSDNTANDDNAILRKSWTSHSDPTNGQTLLQATATEMAITPDTYKYDIQMVSGAGAVTTVIAGNIDIKNDTTKRVV